MREKIIEELWIASKKNKSFFDRLALERMKEFEMQVLEVCAAGIDSESGDSKLIYN